MQRWNLSRPCVPHYEPRLADRGNTRRSYKAATRHFGIEWGFLPATADAIARYLAEHAESLSINTLRQRLAALARRHIDQGFHDPTKAPVVRKVFRGICALHPARENRARPLQLEKLARVSEWPDGVTATVAAAGDRPAQLRRARDKTLLLLSFWRGVRGDELTRLQVHHVDAVPGPGMTCFSLQTKGDLGNDRTTFKAPALARVCPADAYTHWVALAGLLEGPVFRSIDRWRNIGDEALHINRLAPFLRALFAGPGLASAEQCSSRALGQFQWLGRQDAHGVRRLARRAVGNALH